MMRSMKDLLGDVPVPYPHAPGFKTGSTSRDAAVAMAGSVAILREQVRKAIAGAGSKGLTADEAAEVIGRTVLAVRPRVTELQAMRCIVDTGLRRNNISGRPAKAWRIA